MNLEPFSLQNHAHAPGRTIDPLNHHMPLHETPVIFGSEHVLPRGHHSRVQYFRVLRWNKIKFSFCPDNPVFINRACFVPREARGRREWASAHQGSTARPGYAWHVLWERTARARATGIRCHAPPGSSARWWGRWRAPLAQGGIFAPGLVGSTPRLVRPGWCAAETFLPRLTSGVLLVRGESVLRYAMPSDTYIYFGVYIYFPGIAETSAAN